jgi:hypothetical protein
MGATTSTPDFELSEALCHHHSPSDSQFWTNLILNAPPRDTLNALDPELFNDVGLRHHENLTYLGFACAQFCKVFTASLSGNLLCDQNLNQLSWSLSVYTTLLSTVIYNTELFSTLRKLEEPLARAYAQGNPAVARIWEIHNEMKSIRAGLMSGEKGKGTTKNSDDSSDEEMPGIVKKLKRSEIQKESEAVILEEEEEEEKEVPAPPVKKRKRAQKEEEVPRASLKKRKHGQKEEEVPRATLKDRKSVV